MAFSTNPRKNYQTDEPFPTLFSLLHPIEEIYPVHIKPQSLDTKLKISEKSNDHSLSFSIANSESYFLYTNQKIVFSSISSPVPILVTLDEEKNVLLIWSVFFFRHQDQRNYETLDFDSSNPVKDSSYSSNFSPTPLSTTFRLSNSSRFNSSLRQNHSPHHNSFRRNSFQNSSFRQNSFQNPSFRPNNALHLNSTFRPNTSFNHNSSFGLHSFERIKEITPNGTLITSLKIVGEIEIENEEVDCWRNNFQSSHSSGFFYEGLASKIVVGLDEKEDPFLAFFQSSRNCLDFYSFSDTFDLWTEDHESTIVFKSRKESIFAVCATEISRPKIQDLIVLHEIPSKTLFIYLGETLFCSIPSSQDIFAFAHPFTNHIDLYHKSGGPTRVFIRAIPSSDLVLKCWQSLFCVFDISTVSPLYTKWLNRSQNTLELDAFVEVIHLEFFSGIFFFFCFFWPLFMFLSLFYKKENAKQKKQENSWELLLHSSIHHEFGSSFMFSSFSQPISTKPFTTNLLLKTEFIEKFKTVFKTIHCIYENYKTDETAFHFCKDMAPFLLNWAASLGWNDHVDHYLRDFGELNESAPSKKALPDPLEPQAFDIYSVLQRSVLDKEEIALQNEAICLLRVNHQMRKILRLFSILCDSNEERFLPQSQKGLFFQREETKTRKPFPISFILFFLICLESQDPMTYSKKSQRVVETLVQEGFQTLDSIPFGISFPLRKAIFETRHFPEPNLTAESYLLIDRQDLAFQVDTSLSKRNDLTPFIEDSALYKEMVLTESVNQIDGTELENGICYLIFSKDQRLKEARKFLTSSTVQTVNVPFQPSQSDHDLVLSQQKELFQTLQVSLALSVGRGLFTLSTAKPIFTETISFPPLNLTGKNPQTKATINLDPQLLSVMDHENFAWPEFHNGASTGFRIPINSPQISGTWITFNEPSQMSNQHAGFLFALGLNGYLEKLPLAKVNYYLSLGHEIASIAILIGISASKRKSMDSSLSGLLSLHIESLGTSEVQLHQNVSTIFKSFPIRYCLLSLKINFYLLFIKLIFIYYLSN